jgi:predicted AAA+ superfamily ATPase
MQGRFVTWDAFKEHLRKGPPAAASSGAEYRALFDMGGFPEPLTRQDMAFSRIWRQERKTLLVRSDIRDATGIRDISLLEVLSHLVADRVGSPLSINALREELGVAFETARDWIRTLAAFYYLFQIHPHAGSLARTLRKETKAYLFDWAELDDPGLRFENLVASHLLKAVRTWTSIGEGSPELRYVRDREKREVDFVVVEKKKPLCLIESRLGSGDFSEHLLYYQEKLNVPAAVQLVHKSGVMRKRTRQGRVQWLLSADRWLTCLP